jgi:hypothetical protein
VTLGPDNQEELEKEMLRVNGACRVFHLEEGEEHVSKPSLSKIIDVLIGQ